jgi:VWFA-related protein
VGVRVQFAAAVLGFAALGVSAAPHARQAPAPQPTFRTGVDIVQVDVSVLDKDRRPVTGLTPADFTIEVDGRPVPIAAFAQIDLAARVSAAATPTTAAWVKDVEPDVATSDVPRDGRLVVILFDLTLKSVQQVMARRIAARAIDELGPNDLAAVVYVLGGTPQTFTRDRAKLLAAIEKPFPHFGEGAEWVETTPWSRNTPVSQASLRADPRNGLCPSGVCTFEVLTNIADALRDAPRRKMVLFLTAGVPIQSTGPDATDVKAARDRLFRALDVANLTVHAIDPTGLETLAPNADYMTQGRISPNRIPIIDPNLRRQHDVEVIPARTGGRAVMNANQPDNYLPAIFDESESYYMLAFRPQNPKMDGRFHKIDVTVKRNNALVSARKGYYGGGDPSDATRRTIDGVPPALSAPLTASWPSAELPLQVNIAAFAAPDGGRPVVSTVIASSRPRAEPASGADDTVAAAAEVDVVVAAFDSNGRSANYHRQTLGVTSAPGASYEILSRLPLDPGRYEIRIAVNERTAGRTGSTFTFVDVPDFAKAPFALSGLVLDVRPADLVAPEDALADVLPLVPTARRALDRASRANAFLRVHQGGQDELRPVQLTTHIRNDAGKAVFEGTRSLSAEDFSNRRTVDYTFEVPLDTLPPGAYLLTIEASQRSRTERRDLRFSVR